ncbi:MULTISPECIES: HNH endonuclease [unclassified Imperialibacter]|uniref:HNH endonuclease n=1 Tax=unclassified Imperialibacter TaxID=2629706 RepID=UPI00125FE4A0|nr:MULTISPECIES: hypothetical protein [unclassified Imperialibacter]
MKWFRIPKESTTPPTSGSYQDWKPQLADEGRFQCVYCAIHENNFGGTRNFHVEHYRPKSIARFRHLIDDFNNLYYACSICNCFKGNDWPNDPPSNPSIPLVYYPEPSKMDYNKLFVVREDWIINGQSVAAKYLVEKLYLNRPQLILERRSKFLLNRLEKEVKHLQLLSRRISGSELSIELKEFLYQKSVDMLSKAVSLLVQKESIRPYKAEDIEK